LLSLFTSVKVRVLGALAATMALAAVAMTASPAQAALTGSDWQAQKMPAGYLLNAQTPYAPISCVRRTKFCITITNDSANSFTSQYGAHMIGEAALVSTDAGQTWTGYDTLPPPSTFYRALSISCFSASACGVAGLDVHGQPAVIFTADGGKTWTDPTPASWEDVSWQDTSIACVSARTCWVAGYDTLDGGASVPFMMRTQNRGTTWKTFTNLPDRTSKTPYGTYSLNSIFCVSARSCVAVGSYAAIDIGGYGTAIATSDGGLTWTRPASLRSLETLTGVSCVAGGLLAPTCYASGSTAASPQGTSAAVAVSRNGGATWSVQKVFTGPVTGYFGPISCADARHCWTAWGNSPLALAGTADAGASWSTVNSDHASEYGYVSCLSDSVCVATTDQGLWVTRDDGGLRG
jgi:photosystem II stability/assembly factor-like uncharacterized protein